MFYWEHLLLSWWEQLKLCLSLSCFCISCSQIHPCTFLPTGSQQGWWEVTGKAERRFLRVAATQHWGFIFNLKLKKYTLVLARSTEWDQRSFGWLDTFNLPELFGEFSHHHNGHERRGVLFKEAVQTQHITSEVWSGLWSVPHYTECNKSTKNPTPHSSPSTKCHQYPQQLNWPRPLTFLPVLTWKNNGSRALRNSAPFFSLFLPQDLNITRGSHLEK